MLMTRLRVVVSAVAAAAASFAGSALAQITIAVQWTAPDGSPATCLITTDEQGVFGQGTQLTARGSFGPGCPGGAVPAPRITDGLDADELPLYVLAGSTLSASWAADADECDYAASSLQEPVAGWPTGGAVCGSAAACASTHAVSLTLPAPGNYTFALTCRRNGVAAPVVSQRTVHAGPPDAPPCTEAPSGLTRAAAARIESGGVERFTDATRFDSVFGYVDETTRRGFPGLADSEQRLILGPHSYAALSFTVPAGLASGTAGVLRFGEAQPQSAPARMSLTISPYCGGFSTTPVAPLTAACVADDLVPGGGLRWIVGDTAPGFCRLEPGRSYYLNVLYASLAEPHDSYCTGACGNVLQNRVSAGSPPWP